MAAVDGLARRCQLLEERLATYEALLQELLPARRALRQTEERLGTVEAVLRTLEEQQSVGLRTAGEQITTCEALLHELLPEARDMVEERRAERQAKVDAELAERMDREFAVQRQREAESRTYPCAICLDEATIAELYIVDECAHRFCRGCVLGHAKALLGDGNPEITCPFVDPDTGERCTSQIDFQQIRELLLLEGDAAADRLLARYDEPAA